MIKTSLFKTDFLLWSAVSKSSLGIERRRLTWTVLYLNSLGGRKRIPNRKLLPSLGHRSSVPNCTTFSVMFSCFYKLKDLFLCPTPKAFWYTTLLETLVWSLASRLISVPAAQDKLDCHIILRVWCISATQKGFGNSPVLLLSENITPTQKKHAWETGKQKNVEIGANSGMWKLALKSICATFSTVTPLFLSISEKLM